MTQLEPEVACIAVGHHAKGNPKIVRLRAQTGLARLPTCPCQEASSSLRNVNTSPASMGCGGH